MTIRRLIFSTGVAAAALTCAAPANAQEFYIGQILPMGNSYCPRGTAQTDGQLLSISSNTALFSLLGTTYGGNGTTTFALPDLRSRSPIHLGTGPGLSTFTLGEAGGTETVTLQTTNLPAHAHTGHVRASNTPATTGSPGGASIGDFPDNQPRFATAAPDTNMANNTVQTDNTGGNIPFANRSPYLTIRFCIATQGIFPPRN